MRERLWMGAVALALALVAVPAARANGGLGPLSGDWIADVKCEGLQGPAEGMPGAKVTYDRTLHLLIAQGVASAELVGDLAPNSLDVLLGDPEAGGEGIVAAWCGWMNTSREDMTKGQGSLGPFLFSYPISLSEVFRTEFLGEEELELGDSTMYIKMWELTKPDAKGCDAKLEMEGSVWVPGAKLPPVEAVGGAGFFASCKIRAKRCPSEFVPDFSFCSFTGDDEGP